MRTHLMTAIAVVSTLSAMTARAETGPLALDADLLRDAAAMVAEQGVAEQGVAEQGGRSTSLSLLPVDTWSSALPAQKAGKSFGVGLQVGTPTAVTFKIPGSGNADIVLGLGLGVGYDFGIVRGLSIHGDYLFTIASLVNNGSIDLSAYIGPGIWITIFDRGYGSFGGFYYFGGTFLGLGARMPIGLAMSFAAAPLEVYLELDPALFIFPGIDGFIGASLGFRWFF